MKKKQVAWVDTKERNHHPLWFEDGPMSASIPGTFAHEQFEIRERSQEFGDVWIELEPFKPGLVVELKTWPDLLASLRDTAEGRSDTRLRHQLRGLLDLQLRGHKTCVVIVGTLTPAGGKPATGHRPKGVYFSAQGGTRRRASASWFEYEQTRATIQSLGILTYQSPTEAEVPHALRLLADLVSRQEVLDAPGLARLTTLGPRHSFLVTSLTAVPDIGIVTASAIADRFKTFPRFFQASIEEISEVRGVGKPTAMRIHTAFHGYDPDPVRKPLAERELAEL